MARSLIRSKVTPRHIPEIIVELEKMRSSERDGRVQDHYEAYAMQKLRAIGFMGKSFSLATSSHGNRL